MVYVSRGATETWGCLWLAATRTTEVERHTDSPTVQIRTGPPLLPDQLLGGFYCPQRGPLSELAAQHPERRSLSAET